MYTAFISLIVGVVQTGPNMCQIDLLNPDKTLNTSSVKCEYITPQYEILQPY